MLLALVLLKLGVFMDYTSEVRTFSFRHGRIVAGVQSIATLLVFGLEEHRPELLRPLLARRAQERRVLRVHRCRCARRAQCLHQ